MAAGGHYVAIESAPVDTLTDLTQQDFIDDLNAWTSRGKLQWATLTAAVLVVVAALWIRAPLAVVAVLALVGGIALLVARVIEFRRREYLLLYDLDNEAEALFASSSKIVERLARSGLLDSIRLEHIHGDWKRNAGATSTVHSDHAQLERGHLRHLSSNLDPPPLRLHAQNKTLCFLPDRLLVEERGRKAAVSYDALTVSC